MGYPRQSSVLARLERQTRHAMRVNEERHVRHIFEIWSGVKAHLRAMVLAEYHQDFKSETWDLTTARRRGTMIRIERGTRALLASFKAVSSDRVRQAIKATWSEESRRAMWMLDVTTPPGVVVKHPNPKGLTEARRMVSILTGPEAADKWAERWSAWVDAYGGALNHNLGLGALNGSSPSDAADEVEASRVGTPSYDLWTVLDRIFRTEVIGAEARARQDIRDANDDLVFDEVWQTMEDGRVCDVCDPFNGLSRDEVDEDIPAHPMCRCFWRLAPRAWGTFGPTAGLSDDPQAMVLRGPDGRPRAALIVDFESWSEGDRRQVATPGGSTR